jgi:hypothetical protein
MMNSALAKSPRSSTQRRIKQALRHPFRAIKYMKIFSESFAGVATAATRVIELYYPVDKRLFEDPFALKLLPFSWQVLFRLVYLPGLRGVVLSLRERRMPGSLGAILCRTRCAGHAILMTY